MRPISESTAEPGARTSRRQKLARALLWALVVVMGIQLGGGLYELTSVVPGWSRAPAETIADALRVSQQREAARAFWPWISPLVIGLAVANLFVANAARGRVRAWWVGAAMLELFDQIATYTYFVPELLALASGDVPLGEIESRAIAWERLAGARVVIELLAWALALAAFARGRSAHPERDETVATPST
jgi:hypothetical protein